MPEIRQPVNPVGRHVGRTEPRLTLPPDWKPYTYRGKPFPHIPDPIRRTQQRPPCGTNNGYQSHHNHKETPCTDCRAAHAAYIRGTRTQEDE